MDKGVEFQNSVSNDWNVLSIIGRIDVATSAAVEEAAKSVLKSAEKIALDMLVTIYNSKDDLP